MLKHLLGIKKIHDLLFELKPVTAEEKRFLKGYQPKGPALDSSNPPKGGSGVHHPSHYGGDTVYETIKVINAWKLNFELGNAVKYISRAGKKDPAKRVEDLEKAIFYIQAEIKNSK